jgi:predicted DNA-binding transcriptional regulator AlpA
MTKTVFKYGPPITETAEPNKPRLVSFHDLRTRYGEKRSRTQLRRDIMAGLFPAPKQLSAQRIAWVTAELDYYYDNLPTVSYDKETV